MDLYDWILMIIFTVIAIVAGVSIFWAYEWKTRHDDAVEMWCKESESKDNQIYRLQEKVKELESRR